MLTVHFKVNAFVSSPSPSGVVPERATVSISTMRHEGTENLNQVSRGFRDQHENPLIGGVKNIADVACLHRDMFVLHLVPER